MTRLTYTDKAHTLTHTPQPPHTLTLTHVYTYTHTHSIDPLSPPDTTGSPLSIMIRPPSYRTDSHRPFLRYSSYSFKGGVGACC